MREAIAPIGVRAGGVWGRVQVRVGGWVSCGNEGNGEGCGEGGGWGQAKQPASQCARLCQDYPLVSNYP